MNQSQPEKAERGIEETIELIMYKEESLSTDDYRRWLRTFIETHHQELQKTRTAEQERVVGIVEGMRKDIPTRQIHWLQTINKSNRRIARKKAESYNQALTDITEAIMGNENGV